MQDEEGIPVIEGWEAVKVRPELYKNCSMAELEKMLGPIPEDFDLSILGRETWDTY